MFGDAEKWEAARTNRQKAEYFVGTDDPRNGLTDFGVTYAVLALADEVRSLRAALAAHEEAQHVG